MPLVPVNPKEVVKKPSKLDRAAQIFGMATNLASAASNTQDLIRQLSKLRTGSK